MYVAPNTTIHILRGVPLNNRYTDTYDISGGKDTQLSTFLQAKKYTFSNNSYQRYKDGKIRVDINPDNLYDCNYMLFQNTSFGSKWFYAFINEIEYINNETALISYEIDVMQTWINDISYNRCMIERQHSLSDNLFEHTVPESFNNLPMIEVYKTDFDLTPVVWLWSTSNSDGDKGFNPSPKGGIYGTLLLINLVDQQIFSTTIKKMIDNNAIENVVWACMGYNEFNTTNGKAKITKNYSSNTSTLNGYTPRNKKLFTYPYNYITASNSEGEIQEYRYEFFNDTDNITFALYGVCSPNSGGIFVPINYRGTSGDNFDYSVHLGQLPSVALQSDSYRSYIARNGGSITSTVLGIGASVGVAAASGGIGAGIASINALNKAQSLVASIEDVKAAPNPVIGTQGGDAVFSAGAKNIIIKSVCVRPEYAKIIDDYFDLYGYAANIIDFPTHNHRPAWDYVKTNGACNGGNIPSDDIKKINDIFDNGIRFWHKWGTIGNYGQTNKP